MTLYFDMDGTIADLYAVKNWLGYLQEQNPYPYENAEPMVNMASLARILNRLQKQGYEIGIISWLSDGGSDAYKEEVEIAKRIWLKKHLASVHFNEIHIVKYGTPKEETALNPNGILFDDEEGNRNNWTGTAYNVDNIIEILKKVN